MVAVPHRIDETRVLRNMGFNAPSPILHHYEWPGQFKPFHAQLATSEFLTLNPRAFVLNDMGSGKTLASLWAFDYLRQQGLAKKLLVAAPLSTLERTWGDEVYKHFPHLNFAVLHGTKARREQLLAGDADVYIVNHHGLIVLERPLSVRDDIDTMVIDEIATFRNASTTLWKAANVISRKKTRLWGLTGTPTPNAPTDAWAQCRLIAPERVPPYFGKFRDIVQRKQGPFAWVNRDGATEQVAMAMQPSIRFSRADCVDLPPTIFMTRHAEMTPEQKAVYKTMLAKLTLEHDGQQAQAVNEAVKVSKLTQIACGVVYGPDETEIVIPCKPRTDVVKEVINEAATKVIVFVPFRAVLGNVVRELQATFGDAEVVCIHGGVGKSARDNIFSQFQNEHGGPRILVAIPQAMSHGLTLTAANTIIWYGPTNSNETYEQANARVTRPGQKHTQFIVNVEGSAVERKAYARLQGRQKMQGMLLDVIREGGV